MRLINKKWVLAVGTAAAVCMGAATLLAAQGQKPARPIQFAAVETQTRTFIRYYNEIRLTPEQQKVKEAALGPLKAVCCKGFSALTCCCPCNFSKSLWGMTHYLIAERGYDAEQVQAAARAWIAYVNPSGFSGDVCQTGGCNRPFASNGCGGMNENAVVFPEPAR